MDDYSDLNAIVDERVAAALAARAPLAVSDLPLKQLQDKLELDWHPDAKILLEGSTITAALIAPPDDWTLIGATGAPAFQSSWVNYGAPLPPARFYKDAVGAVRLSGTIKNGTINATAFTLPPGFRPANRLLFAVSTNSGAVGRCDVFANGDVLPSAGTNADFSFDNVTFRAEG